MYISILKFLFISVAFILAILLTLREFGLTRKMSPMKASDFISTIAGFLLAYIVISALIAILIDGTINKLIMIFFAISPFIIGRLVTYKKVKMYSIIQIVCVIFSLGYLFII